ncbi:unknow (plasmid) [Vibrio campbellii]|nr:unknow [Vibrio campbellii]
MSARSDYRFPIAALFLIKRSKLAEITLFLGEQNISLYTSIIALKL